MGNPIPFYGNPAVALYAPTVGETGVGLAGWGDEVNASLILLADHDHGDAGGQTFAFALVDDVLALAVAASAGVSLLPARGDHRHEHGDLAGEVFHSDYSLLTHAHTGDFAAAAHAHPHTHDPAVGDTLWDTVVDATYGDTLRALVADVGGTGTSIGVREHPSGAVEIVHGNVGAAATNLDSMSPMLNFIQTNTQPDGTPPDMLGNGMITFTSWASGERRWGDVGTSFDDFPFHRGDANVYAGRVQPTVGIWTGATTMGWRMGQHRHNDSVDYLTRSYTRRRLSRLSFAVRPDWGEASDPWPAQMDVDEDGNFWARGDAEFGGHSIWFGTNNVDGWSQDSWTDTVDDGFGRQIARIRHTVLNIMSAPPGNDAGGTGAAILFYPWLDATARGGNSPRGADWPASSKNDSGFVADLFGIAYDHDVRIDETRVTFDPAAGQPGVILYGTSPNGAVQWGSIIAGFTLYKDDSGNGVDYAGLLWTYGAKHGDVRVHGTYDAEATLVIARGDTWGGGNRHGRLIFADNEFGFGYEGGPHFELAAYGNVSTAPGYEAQMNLTDGYGLALRYRDNYSAEVRTLFTVGTRPENPASKQIAFSNHVRVLFNNHVMVGGGNDGGTGLNGQVAHIYRRESVDGHWWRLERGAANAAVWVDVGSSMPI